MSPEFSRAIRAAKESFADMTDPRSLGLRTVAGLREAGRIEILLTATLKGILISLLTALSLGGRSPWWHGAGYGMLYGFSFGLVIFLAKGAFKSKDAPYVVPSSTIIGLITGVLLAKFAFQKI